MPLFLLHDIFPKGPGAGWLVLGVLLLVLFWVLAKVLVVLGFVVAVARGRARVGPLNLRDVKPPGMGLWLASLAACTLAGALAKVESVSLIGEFVTYPGMDTARIFADRPLSVALLGILLSTIHWTLALTGARALRTMLRR